MTEHFTKLKGRMMNSKKTAISRKKMSLPAMNVVKLIRQIKMNPVGYWPTMPILDFGCGKGMDVREMKAHGWECDGYDPHFSRELDTDKEYGLVMCNYVLNVVKMPYLPLVEMLGLKSRQYVIAARHKKEIDREGTKNNWKRYGKGYITKAETYQRGFTAAELIEYMEAALEAYNFFHHSSYRIVQYQVMEDSKFAQVFFQIEEEC